MLRELKLVLPLMLMALPTFSQIIAPVTVEERNEFLKSLLEPPRMPTVVSLGVTLLSVKSIEAASNEDPKLTAQFKLHIQWVDDRLIPSDGSRVVLAYQGKEVDDKLGEMFSPRIQIAGGDSDVLHQHLHIFPNGTINIHQAVTVTVPANMDLTHFPFDNQFFSFRFASTTWDNDSVELVLNPVESGMSEKAAPSSWHFDFSSYYISDASIEAHTETFSVFNFLLHAQRDPRYFIWRLILPLLVIVILSWNVFWLFEDSSAAFGNCVVFLLTVVAFHQIANGMLPVIPSFTFIDSIVFLSYGFIIIPTFQVIITTKLEYAGKNDLAAEIRRYCRWVVPMSFVLSMLAVTLAYFSIW